MRNNLDKEVHNYLLSINNLDNLNIAIGYSAGADSTALLHILKRKSDFFNFILTPVFFIHKGSPITEGEDKNLILAEKTCKELGLNLNIVELELERKNNESWEDLGRKGRNNFYKNSNFDLIFLGHHLDDQNETTMTQLFRGGLTGSSGMKSRNGKFCRPLLKIEKEEIYDFLKRNEIEWLEDPTNENTDFTRNFWRKVGLPTIEAHYPGYKQTLESFRNKLSDQNKISYDMAIVDGLNNLLEGKPIEIDTLEDYRKNNLIHNLFRVTHSHSEENKVKNLLKVGKSHDGATLIISSGSLTIKDGLLTFNSKLENKLSTRNKP